jgi:hypothetical protein
MSVQTAEISRTDAMRSLLTNHELSDLTLRGTDGALVIANRCLLASRSPVFCSMLFGPFAEASKTTVDLGYDGVILQAIVEYIYMDHIPELEAKTEEEEDGDDEADDDEAEKSTRRQCDRELVRFLVTLVDAAEYFALPELRRKAEASVEAHMERSHLVAILVLAACAPDCAQVLRQRALDLVKTNPKLLLKGDTSSVALIHPCHVEEILKDDRLPMDELSCFRIVESWANAEHSNDDNNKNQHDSSSTDDEERSDWRQHRKRIAAQMTSHIDLARIPASELSTTVTCSRLVSLEQLCNAYMAQALRSEKKYGTSFYTQWRGGIGWKSTRTTILENVSEDDDYADQVYTERLDCPVMTSGVYKWSIKILKGGGSSIVLGVASTRWPILSHESLLRHRGGWGLYERCAYHAMSHDKEAVRRNLQRFSTESVVSFTLDLERGGILTASINDNAPFEVFSNMCQDHGEGYGFVPAVTITYGMIEFLGFDKDS